MGKDAEITQLSASETPERHFAAGGMRPRPWSAGPGTHFPLHHHERTKHLFVTRGSITFNAMEYVAPAGIVIPAGLIHEAEAGPHGVRMHGGVRMTTLHDLLEIDSVADPLFGENCYVLRRRDADRCLLVDPGLQAEAVLRLLSDRGLACDRILVSHGHPDHVAGIPAVQARHRCRAAIHPADRPLLERVAGFPGVPEDLTAPFCEEDLSDGQVVDWQELQIAVLHTPGHTPGSVCFLIGPDLLSGDTLFQRGIGRTDLPGGSFETLLFSIQNRLYTLSPDTAVHPGHGPATTIGEERRENPFVRAPGLP